jgi:branched-chain amino acid transport system permease protein
MFLYAALLLMMIRFLPGGLLGGSDLLSVKNLRKRKASATKGGDKS